ncbi:butyrophilin subfamily 1 member A1-like [Pelodiscus sinensis]|uniref:butyrophilin subfamily 1 member A1-like n=1 Tax=Pelodiscus sinensis TaxID=13735 RepID=UPI003F6CC764
MKVLLFSDSSGFSSPLLGFSLYFITFYVNKLEPAQFKVLGPDQPVTAVVDGEIVLLCHLNPRKNAENMEVTWFRSQLSPFVHRYSAGKDEYGQQMPEYQGRTELLRDGLPSGSVALRISRVRLSDEGQYSCFVQDGSNYEEALLELKVAASGSAPHISVEDYQDGGIRVVCRSARWYPEPEVLWRDHRGQPLPSFSPTKTKVASHLYEIQTSIIITEDSNPNFSCLVRNTRLSQEKESTLFYISEPFFPKVNPWIVVTCVVLVALAGSFGLSAYFFKIKEKQAVELQRQAAELRWRRLVVPIEEAKVTLDPNTAHRNLILSKDGKHVSWAGTRQDLPDNLERFDSDLSVLCCEGFASGTHCWEVEAKVGGGIYWAVGVARESVGRKGKMSHKPEEGIWAVKWWGDHIKVLTSPETLLPLKQAPSRIRVCLDCDQGQVAFFDADAKAQIFTFPPGSIPGEKIRPWLWVGWQGKLSLDL